MMRAKMAVVDVVRHNDEQVDLEMAAVCADEYSADGMDENNTFAQFTPNATLTMSVRNPALINSFNKGQTFYVDFTEVE